MAKDPFPPAACFSPSSTRTLLISELRRIQFSAWVLMRVGTGVANKRQATTAKVRAADRTGPCSLNADKFRLGESWCEMKDMIRWFSISFLGTVVLYVVVVIPAFDYATRAYFDQVTQCTTEQVHNPDAVCKTEFFDANDQLILPWWVKIYDHITFRPFIA